MKSINLTPLVGKFTMVKHDYDTDDFIESRIQSKLQSLHALLDKEQPEFKHHLYYELRENSSRYIVNIFDNYTFIVDSKKCFAQFNSKLSLDDLLK